MLSFVWYITMYPCIYAAYDNTACPYMHAIIYSERIKVMLAI